jgi:hypothetical protein
MNNGRPFLTHLLAAASALGMLCAAPAKAQNSASPPSVADLARAQEARERTLKEFRDQARVAAGQDIERTRASLTKLRSQVTEVTDQLKDLASNNDGRKLSSDRALVSVIFHKGLMTVTETVANVDARLSTLDKAKSSLESAQGQEFDSVATRARETAIAASAWVELRAAELSERQNFFKAALKAAPADAKPDAPTLREALDSYAIAFDRWSVDLFRQGVEQGKGEKENELVAKGRLAALLEAEQKLRLLEESTRVRMQEEKTMREAEFERQLDRVAELERENQRLRAERALKDAKSDAATNDITRKADREKLLDRARSPEVRALLTNLSVPGFKQPGREGGMRNDLVKPVPISLAQLRSSGALEQTPKGMQYMMRVLSDPKDTDRPRKAFSRKSYGDLKGDEKEWLGTLQSTINELGDALVEVELLSP